MSSTSSTASSVKRKGERLMLESAVVGVEEAVLPAVELLVAVEGVEGRRGDKAAEPGDPEDGDGVGESDSDSEECGELDNLSRYHSDNDCGKSETKKEN